MTTKPDIIIHFDDSSYLEHYGIPGMKWGVRKELYREYKENAKKIKSDKKRIAGTIKSQVKQKGLLKGVRDAWYNNRVLQDKLYNLSFDHEVKKINKLYHNKKVKEYMLKNIFLPRDAAYLPGIGMVFISTGKKVKERKYRK